MDVVLPWCSGSMLLLRGAIQGCELLVHFEWMLFLFSRDPSLHAVSFWFLWVLPPTCMLRCGSIGHFLLLCG